MSQEELEALVHEYASGSRQDISPRFLAVLRESAGAAPPGDALPAAPAPGGSSSEGGSSRGLVPLYQQLYAVSVVQCLKDCLEAPQAPAAAAWLAGLQPVEAVAGGDSAQAVEGSSRLEQVLAAAAEGAAATQQMELEHRLSQQVRRQLAACAWCACIGLMRCHCLLAADAPPLPNLLPLLHLLCRRTTMALPTNRWSTCSTSRSGGNRQARRRGWQRRGLRSRVAAAAARQAGRGCQASWPSWQSTCSTIA